MALDLHFLDESSEPNATFRMPSLAPVWAPLRRGTGTIVIRAKHGGGQRCPTQKPTASAEGALAGFAAAARAAS